jgi:hypothetical protein
LAGGSRIIRPTNKEAAMPKSSKKAVVESDKPANIAQPQCPLGKAVTKTDRILELLRRPDGAALSDLMEATGWQAHSVRGALAGTLKKRGFEISSEKIEGVRRYRVVGGADEG